MDNRTVENFRNVEDFKALLKRLVRQAGPASHKIGVDNAIPIRTITVQMIVDSRWLDSTIEKHINYWRNHRLTNPDCTINDSTSHPNRNKDNVIPLNKKANPAALRTQRETADATYKAFRKERDRLKRIRDDALPLWHIAKEETTKALAKRDRLDALIAGIGK